MAGNTTLVNQRDKLAKDLEEALKNRDAIKLIMTDPKKMDEYLSRRVASIKENIAILDLNDQNFVKTYCDMQARIAELNKLRADLHMPENNCKEIGARLDEINAQIDALKTISKRQQY
jgi:translation elongation factor EF-Ts